MEQIQKTIPLSQIQGKELNDTMQMLRRASEVTNRVDDPQLDEMIHRLDYTPADELNIDLQDQMNIYNWLRELELYHKLCGPLNKV